MKVSVAAHFPLNHPGPRCTITTMDVDHTLVVSDFIKAYVEKVPDVDPKTIRVCLNGSVRTDDQTLADEPLKSNAPNDKCFIHLQIQDLEMNAAVEKFFAEGGTCIVDDVKIKGQEETESSKQKAKEEGEEEEENKESKNDDEEGEEKQE
eukprot:m.839 g.839  ORF g.839 m.839 type:complete len:150 (+) comp605_c0_seq1:42-491(+)